LCSITIAIRHDIDRRSEFAIRCAAETAERSGAFKVRCPKCDQSQAGNAVRKSLCFQQATGLLCAACGTTADRSRICPNGHRRKSACSCFRFLQIRAAQATARMDDGLKLAHVSMPAPDWPRPGKRAQTNSLALNWILRGPLPLSCIWRGLIWGVISIAGSCRPLSNAAIGA
jgi:hypothetical protein